MNDRPKGPALTRRRFVTMVAAGSAAMVAAPLAAAAAVAHPARAHKGTFEIGIGDGPGTPEYDRQSKATLDTLAVLRKHAMGPGTEMASVFRALKSPRRNG